MKNVSFYSTFFYFVTELNFNLKFSKTNCHLHRHFEDTPYTAIG